MTEAQTQPTEPSVPPLLRGDKQPRILRAAVDVFAAEGYHATRVSRVAAAAGVATGTIYLYFNRKEDLLLGVFQRYLGGYLKSCRPELEATPRGAARLRKLVELHFAFFAEDKALAAVFQIHIRDPDPVIREGIEPLVIAYFDVIATVIEDGVREGDFDPGLDVRLARKVFFGALDEVVTGWVRARHDYPLMSLAAPTYGLVSRALGARERGDS